jgi:PAS domain S-box-containing protein
MDRNCETSANYSTTDDFSSGVLILMDGERDRNLLQSELEKELEVFVRPEALHDEGIGLIIADRRNLSARWEELLSLRKADQIFLPVLLLTKEQDRLEASSELWRGVDEMLQMPVGRRQLHLRVQMLLRARKYSQLSARRYRRLSEEMKAVERKKAAYERLFVASRDPIFLIGTSGNILKANPAAHRLVDCEENGLAGQSMAQFFQEPAQFDELQSTLREDESVEDVEAGMCRTDGSTFIGNISASMHAPNAEYGNACQLIIRDISDVKAYERDLIQARETAEEMNRLKSAFLANMSHEIRTPLASIIGYADLLLEQVPERLKTFIEVIHAAGERLLWTLDSVLSLAQLQSGSIEVRVEEVDVGALVRDIVERLAPEADRNELQLEFDEPVEPVIGRIDQNALTQIVSHLTHNAVKFTPEGSVKIDIGTVETNDGFFLSVSDTGIGIDDVIVPDLFQAFRQASTGKTRQYEGAGLGLTLTKELVELMDGSITVETEQGIGTSFMVEIPWAKSEDQPDRQTLHSAHEWGLEALPPNQRVLIVDDDPAVRGLLGEMLPQSYEVDTARKAEEAFAHCEKNPYDIVLLDINLKDTINGVEVHERLRDDVLPDALIVAITAYAQTGDGEHFHEIGFDGYVPKPFTKAVLFENLVQVMA